jgi:cytochrome c-type biogenesis protein CcmH/NrfG
MAPVDSGYYLGVAYANKGDRAQAMAVYKRLKSLSPPKAEKFFRQVVSPSL